MSFSSLSVFVQILNCSLFPQCFFNCAAISANSASTKGKYSSTAKEWTPLGC